MSTTVTASTFDIPSVQSSINAAIATMGREDRFNLLLHADLTSGSIGVLWKFGGHVEAVAKVTKPWQDKWGASVDVRVHFALSPAGEIEPRVPPDSFLTRWSRAYRLFRPPLVVATPNGRLRSLVKALGLVLGRHPYLDGRRWFA